MERYIELINEKLSLIYNEIMDIRRDLLNEKTYKDVKELEAKVKNSQEELETRKNNIRWDMEYLDNNRKRFWEMDREFHRQEEVRENVAIERL